MMKYFLMLLICLSPFLLKAQTVTATKHANTTANYKAIDVEPRFPGGAKAFNKFLSKNVVYPQTADDSETHGAVTLAVAIEPDGTVTDIKIIKSLSEVMDKETIRLMTFSPKWKPGMQGGKPMRVRSTFTINYALIGDKR
jgi:protein TonB